MATTEHVQPAVAPPGDPPPVGECQCGCGRRTNLAKQNCHRAGTKKGQPRRFLRGHHRRKRVRYVAVSRGYKTPCHAWLLCKDRDGYGKEHAGDKMALAHRVAYEKCHERLPEGGLDHLCGYRDCINPDHLETVSQAENVRRGRNTKLTPSDVAEIRRSHGTQHVIGRRRSSSGTCPSWAFANAWLCGSRTPTRAPAPPSSMPTWD